MIGSEPMKRLALIILGCAMMFSCGDTFSEEYQKERLAARAGGKTFALSTGTMIISFNEQGSPGMFSAHLTAPPESDVVLDFTKAEITCVTGDVEETLLFTKDSDTVDRFVFTPDNYSVDQTVDISASGNEIVDGTRGHRIILPPLESDDPLYNGVKAPTVYVTVFEDDLQPSMFPIMPDPGETDVALYKEIKVQFDRAEMDPDSIIANTSVKDDADNVIPFTIRFDAGTKSATLYPHGYYKANTEYTVTMNKAIHDVYGNILEKDWVWSFKTKAWTPVQKARYSQRNDGEIFVSGNYAYTARYTDGLDIFDISSPANPVLVANYKHPVATNFYGIYVNGNYAYVADNDYGLRILDVSNKAAPFLTGSCQLAWGAYTVRVEGTRAYVINGSLQSIDITNPSAPVAENYCNLTGSSYDLFLADGYAYVAAGSAGLHIIDISTTPGTPVSIGSCDTPDTAMGIYVEDTHAYVADESNGLLVMDVSDPEHPSITGHAGGSGLWAEDVHVIGSNAYVAGNSGMLVVDISSPDNPVIVSQYQLEYVEFHYIFVKSDYAYLTDWDMSNGALHVVDISNPAAFVDRGTAETTGAAYHAVSAGDYTYVASGDLFIFNTYSKELVNTCGLTGARRVTVVDNKAYVAADANGLKIVDVSNPASPSIIGGCDTPGSAYSVDVSGNYAYVADMWNGLQIIDISVPSAASIKKNIPITSVATGIMVMDSYAYVSFGSSGDEGLQIIDVTDPLNPGTPVVYVIPGVTSANDVYVRGNYAYVSCMLQGLKIIDISDTANPFLVSTFPTTDNVGNTFVSGDNAFIANYEDGLLVVDISDPYNPYLRYRFDTEGEFMGVSVSGPNVVAADTNIGVHFFMQPW